MNLRRSVAVNAGEVETAGIDRSSHKSPKSGSHPENSWKKQIFLNVDMKRNEK